MGKFHCPVGAASKEMEGCIYCGMCEAITKEDKKRAADLIREYLKSQASIRTDKYVIRKIAVCGKGGVGKSTISSMMAIALRDMGYEVLVIDSDESNPGFYRKLGFKNQPKPLLSLIEKAPDSQASDNDWITQDSISLSDIPEEYIVSENRINLMMAGKIEDPFQGCACSMSDIMKMLLQKIVLQPKQILLVDNEAGVESFGRGLESGADTILAIVEPSLESIDLAATIKYMAEGIGIARVRAILNKIPDEKTKGIILEKLQEQEVRYLGALKTDGNISEAGLSGAPVKECKAKDEIEIIVRLMLDEAEMTYNET